MVRELRTYNCLKYEDMTHTKQETKEPKKVFIVEDEGDMCLLLNIMLQEKAIKHHFDFHFPWSWETMWRISGSISFSMASLTAPLEPGTEIRILPRAVPAAARLMIAAEPMSW